MNRRFFLVVFLFTIAFNPALFAQVKNYESQWKTVQSLVEKELPASALAEVKKIYAQAKKENQEAQVVKTLVYMIELQHQTRENNLVTSITEIEKELSVAREPVRSLLKSLLAGLYWNYFQQNRWKLYDRSRTINFVLSDLATWSGEDIHRKIGELFLGSIEEKETLQEARLSDFDAIIEKGNVRHLRPTLYDLLAFRALDYFRNDERSIQKPVYAFEISQAEAFAPAATFSRARFETRDSLSLHHKALLIYQELLAFHLKDAKPDALIDADLNRLEFVHDHSVHPEKDQLYLAALNAITEKYGDLPAASQAWFLVAQFLNQKAATYQPYGDSTHRYARVEAKKILERILVQKDSSEGRINAHNLLQNINNREFAFEIEKVNLPGVPMRVMVTYRNVERLNFRLVKTNERIRDLAERQYEDDFWNALRAAPTVKEWNQPLPVVGDLQQHRVEIRVDALPIGEYVLIATTEPGKGQAGIEGARIFNVSNISFINNERDHFVLHRETGQPLANASVQVWHYRYDYQQSRYRKTKGKSHTTDANGFFLLEKQNEDERYGQQNYLLEIEHGTDRLFLNEQIYNYYYADRSKPRNTTSTNIFLFTDRSIYRPGQTVYFKGIVILRESEIERSRVNDDYQTTLYLRNASYQVIDSIRVKTNEFGSFSGKFQLPSAGMTGIFSLFTKKDGAQAQIRMEEYKRPKFYVEFEPVKNTYRVNDEITVTGNAKAYAGNNLDGATVKYRVERRPRFIYPWLTWRWWLPQAEPMEIAHGEAVTDENGRFQVSFKALPDLKIDRKFEPVFDYVVYADVTDINGETRSGEHRVSVGYKSLMLLASVPEKIQVDSLRSLTLKTTNMNGEHQPARVTVTFTLLKPEQRLIRERYWQRPDQFVMTREEYLRHFPYDEYDNESSPRTWETDRKVFEKTDTSSAAGAFPLTGATLVPGYYAISFETMDKDGQLVKDVKYVELFDARSGPAVPTYIWKGNEQTVAAPGETAVVSLGTSADNVRMIQFTDRTGADTRSYSYLPYHKEIKALRFPVNADDRGGYGLGWIFVKHNRVHQAGETIEVPWTNKELVIEYATFRDKTLPGSEEKWKIRISGKNNEKIAAEMLATMYDASLDQFSPHRLSTPSIWPVYASTASWQKDHNFSDVNSFFRPRPETMEYKALNKQYDQLIFAEQIYSPRYYRTEAAPQTDEVVVTAMGKVSREREEGDAVANQASDTAATQADEKTPAQGSEVQIRKNFNETAFFFPELRTDSAGTIEFSFTLPEALTRWKFMGLAHTKDAAFGNTLKEIVTQKELMVQPNNPRFLREGDRMELSTKIVNLTDREFTGTAELQLFDAASNQPVDGWFKNSIPNQYFTVGAGQSEVVRFPIEVPYQFSRPLVFRVIARAGNLSDGEENVMPVLTNRMLVTESIPLPMKGEGTKAFSFPKLTQSGSSNTLQHHALTVEFTSNPVWYAVQALPYLMEYPYECAEQHWNRYYANSLASHIANASPRIRQVFESWKTSDTAALMSNLQKNPELKAVLLEETPWVLAGKSEAEQKKNIALLFDLVRMSQELNNSYEKLKQMQSSNGGFVWFKGGPDDRFITQYIVTGIGHLKKLGAVARGQESRLDEILQSAVAYLDRKIREDYDHLVKIKADLKKKNIGYTQFQYLYMRSFFTGRDIPQESRKAYDYYFGQAREFWTGNNKYVQGMTALVMHRSDESKTAAAIIASLRETAIKHEELGMYWTRLPGGWFWYEAPIETQALMVEVFSEITKDVSTVDDLRTWLLKNKQTNHWNTTKATAEATYALLLQGSGPSTIAFTAAPEVEIRLGSTVVSSSGNKVEAGTGYFKSVISGDQVNPTMGDIRVTVTKAPSKGAASWGAVYWQYFEELDKISSAETPLKLSKKIFVEKNTDRGPVLTPVEEGGFIRVGDKIRVRVELRVDRDMEYVHMKDMRASAMEPVNVLSGYRWQGGLGYYESTRDASTNFFFHYLGKGTYVFEYSLFATHPGNFSNGITTIQSMYAPEFSAHSEGIRINIE